MLLRNASASLMFPSVDAERVLSQFYAGYSLNASLKSAKNSQIERLEGVGEVWAFCFRKPRPGWRLFGRFVGRDIFVASAGYDRHELAAKGYEPLAVSALDDLDRRFPNLPTHVGEVLHDYITGPIWDMD